ncbi:hypothetical protein ACIG87_15210 [Micromonospora sp. NPDC051925]|uniref:hypothetical protein n=1 Tax=Micromonospora sp. NPDC051925 TaxID=3364288 RepID=UPI0037CA921E
MLQNSWYLTEGDFFAQLPSAPRLDDDGQAVIGQVANLFHDESYFSPAKTVATVHVLLLAAEHLGDNLSFDAAARRHDLTELARLVGGLNLVQAHLTQIIQRIAEHIDARAFNGLDAPSAAAVQTLTNSLSSAGVNGEISADYLKEAHLTLRGLTK